MSDADAIIERFRSDAGVLGGHSEGKTTLLLNTRGRETGREFVNPLVAAPYGDDSYIVCGSMGGAQKDPQWFANLEATAGFVAVEVGSATLKAAHREIRTGRDDWECLYGIWRAYWPDAIE